MISFRTYWWMCCLFVVGWFGAAAFSNEIAAAECGIHGRVLAIDESGALKGIVPGATIEFRNQALEVAAVATADANGYYQTELPPGIYYYKVQSPGYRDEDVGRGIQLELSEGLAVYNFSLTAGPQQAPAPPEIATSPVGTLAGRVLEKTSSNQLVGIPGATVALRKQDGPRQMRRVVAGTGTDEQSHGQYSAVLEIGSWVASASATGFDTYVDPNPVNLESGKTTSRDFVLSRSQPPKPPAGQGVKGLVVLHDPPAGEAVDQAKLSVVQLDAIPPKTIASVSPDNQGNYTCDLAAGDFIVIAELAGMQPAYSGPKHVFPGKYTIADLRLFVPSRSETTPDGSMVPFAAQVVGRSSDDVSKMLPLPGATVWVAKSAADLGSGAPSTADAGGRIEVALGEPGLYWVRAKMQGYKPADLQVPVEKDVQGRSVIVLDPLQTTPPTTAPSTPVAPTPPPARTWQLAVAVYQEIAAQGSQQAGTKRPLAGASVLVRKEGQSLAEAKRETTGSDGIARVTLDQSGQYQALARVEGFEPAGASTTLDMPGEKTLEILLRPLSAPDSSVPAIAGSPLNVRLRVLDSEQRAIAGASVEIRRGEDLVFQGRSDARGAFAAGPLDRSRYYAFVSKPGYQTKQLDITQPEGDFVTQVVLHSAATPPAEESPGGLPPVVPTQPAQTIPAVVVTLDVFVFEEDRRSRRPVPGAQVVVQSGRRSVGTAVVGRDGKAHFMFPVGDYKVVVTHPDYSTGHASVSLGQGPASTAILLSRLATVQPPVIPDGPASPTAPATPVGPAGAALQVQVASSNARGQLQMLPDVQVTVTRGRKIIATQITDANGYTSFRLPLGDYYLGTAKEGYQAKRESVSLKAGGSLQRIVLDAAGSPTIQVAPGMIKAVPLPVQPPTYALTINAVVQSEKSGTQPIRGATITVTATAKEGDHGQETTDDSGRCGFRLRAGEYRIQIDAGGYHRATSTTQLTADAALSITLQSSVDIR